MTNTAVAEAPVTDLSAFKFRLNFFKLIVSDIDRATDFYQRTFGFTETNRITMPDLVEVMLVLPDQTFHLVLYQHTDSRTLDIGSGYGPVGMITRDVEGAYAHALAQGAADDRAPFDLPGMRIAFVVDPDGHQIELIQFVRPAAPKE